MKGITPLINQGNGCDYHRIILPLENLGVDIGYFADKKVAEVIGDTKVLFFNRIPPPGSLETFKIFRKSVGYKIVVDLDDYWVLHPKHILYQFWTRNNIGQQIVDALKIADVVICTTNRLAAKIIEFNKNVHVIPNAIPFGVGQFTSERTATTDRIRFIYTGGSSHFWDVRELINGFTKVANDPSIHPASFTLAGYDDRNDQSKKEWDKIERSFTANGKIKNYVRRTSLPLESYMDHYNYGDVALAPLENTHFNYFKSNLKILEAGSKNMPIICSNTPPYADEEFTPGIFYANNARDWHEHIKAMANNPELRMDMGNRLYEYVRRFYNLTEVNEYRRQLFESLIN